jgi:hypothetical protein
VETNERGVWVAVNRQRRTGTDALPYINTPSFGVPDATLGVDVPVDVELPDTRCVADDSGHVAAGSWIGINFEGGEGRSEDRSRYGESGALERGGGVESRWRWEEGLGYL